MFYSIKSLRHKLLEIALETMVSLGRGVEIPGQTVLPDMVAVGIDIFKHSVGEVKRDILAFAISVDHAVYLARGVRQSPLLFRQLHFEAVKVSFADFGTDLINVSREPDPLMSHHSLMELYEQWLFVKFSKMFLITLYLLVTLDLRFQYGITVRFVGEIRIRISRPFESGLLCHVIGSTVFMPVIAPGGISFGDRTEYVKAEIRFVFRSSLPGLIRDFSTYARVLHKRGSYHLKYRLGYAVEFLGGEGVFPRKVEQHFRRAVRILMGVKPLLFIYGDAVFPETVNKVKEITDAGILVCGSKASDIERAFEYARVVHVRVLVSLWRQGGLFQAYPV